jgi:hypothetical protein
MKRENDMDKEWIVATTENGVFLNSKAFIKEEAAIDYMTEMAEMWPGYDFEMREVEAKSNEEEPKDNP